MMPTHLSLPLSSLRPTGTSDNWVYHQRVEPAQLSLGTPAATSSSEGKEDE